MCNKNEYEGRKFQRGVLCVSYATAMMATVKVQLVLGTRASSDMHSWKAVSSYANCCSH